MDSGMQRRYRVAVRALCEFTAKEGDLDLRFTPSPSAQEGIAGHALVASRRPAGYRKEVALQGQYRNLAIHGRADGFDPQLGYVEEIKTHRGDLARQPANHRLLHWAQVKLYGALLCRQFDLATITLKLVYLDIDSRTETVFEQCASADELQHFFAEQCERFLQWAEQELMHRQKRDQSLEILVFPHADFRSGQRQLAEAVYKAACLGRSLMLQAPTGIGKTLGTLFPLLKAMPGQTLDRLFFLSARTPGRAIALEALALLSEQLDGKLRVLELAARDKVCEYPGNACQGESCPLARGFYDRLPAARGQSLREGWLDQRKIVAIAGEHQICPYYLAQELTRWSDVVVGDYNYYFDIGAILPALVRENQWRVAVLVDEAHNLLERGRLMYSAALDQQDFRHARRRGPPALKKSFDRIARHWNELARNQQNAYQAYEETPDRFINALQKFIAATGEYLADNPASTDSGFQRFYFDAMQFVRIAEIFTAAFLFDIDKTPADTGHFHAGSRLCLRNVVPAAFLAERFAASHSTVLFSATLAPQRFYRDLLGVPEDAPWLEVSSPFQRRQLELRLTDRISTRYRHRSASRQPIAALMARQFHQRRGNYLAFFSSFAYLDQVYAFFREHYPQIPCWTQTPRMSESERQSFLGRFVADGEGIGFAVLGGAFGEGIDLAGDRLIGAFIATLGLPQFNPVNEQIRRCLEKRFGADAGYDYAYLYPGLQKIVQAAGRVIRAPEERGVLHLIDDRFSLAKVRALLPKWWGTA